MLGAIVGDVVGSLHEWDPVKSTDFMLLRHGSMFTDDTVTTVAIAQALLTDGDYTRYLKEFGSRHYNRGYGTRFFIWMRSDNPNPYGSFGNGSAMRVSPVAWARDSVEEVLAEAERSSIATHDHPEGIKGAQAVALAIYLARTGSSKDEIRHEITSRFDYDLSLSPDEIRPTYVYDVTCQGSVPQSIVCFLASDSFEHAIRLAVSLGGDADTMACIAGSIAEPFFGGVPEDLAIKVRSRLSDDLLEVLDRFQQEHIPGYRLVGVLDEAGYSSQLNPRRGC